MRSEVERLEGIVNDESKVINNAAANKIRESLYVKAQESLECMRNLLSVNQQQLDVQKEDLSYTKENLSYMKEIAKSTETDINLPEAANAPYNSAEDQDIPLCQEGTRVAIRNRIADWVADWVADRDAETIFWLSGPAGTGKSTISRTLAYDLARTGQLGASYFFKRGDEARNGTALFFPTITSELARKIGAFHASLTKAQRELNRVQVDKKALEEQFRMLL